MPWIDKVIKNVRTRMRENSDATRRRQLEAERLMYGQLVSPSPPPRTYSYPPMTQPMVPEPASPKPHEPNGSGKKLETDENGMLTEAAIEKLMDSQEYRAAVETYAILELLIENGLTTREEFQKKKEKVADQLKEELKAIPASEL